MIGCSEAFRTAQALINKLAAFEAPTLIEGETGTGKELAARAIHYGGPRHNGPFVPVNCGALPDLLIENELFGHRRGAFTDARDDQLGLVEVARSGTLFFDEIDMLTPKGQVTLLRFLQDLQFRPLGGKREQQADVRVIAASNRNLKQQIETGEFRLDLLHRLNLLYLFLPPLRARHGDIPLLAEHFVRLGSVRYRKQALPLDPATLAWFERYHWPGNIRELENLIVRGFLLADGLRILIAGPAALGASSVFDRAALNYRSAKRQAITEFEVRFLTHLIEQAKGNVSVAARIAGTERRHLGRLLKKHSISKLSSHPL
jgi:DNA-binding NtrC family response regulator